MNICLVVGAYAPKYQPFINHFGSAFKVQQQMFESAHQAKHRESIRVSERTY